VEVKEWRGVRPFMMSHITLAFTKSAPRTDSCSIEAGLLKSERDFALFEVGVLFDSSIAENQRRVYS
jgi:hypothetical protein